MSRSREWRHSSIFHLAVCSASKLTFTLRAHSRRISQTSAYSYFTLVISRHQFSIVIKLASGVAHGDEDACCVVASRSFINSRFLSPIAATITYNQSLDRSFRSTRFFSSSSSSSFSLSSTISSPSNTIIPCTVPCQNKMNIRFIKLVVRC